MKGEGRERKRERERDEGEGEGERGEGRGARDEGRECSAELLRGDEGSTEAHLRALVLERDAAVVALGQALADDEAPGHAILPRPLRPQGASLQVTAHEPVRAREKAEQQQPRRRSGGLAHVRAPALGGVEAIRAARRAADPLVALLLQIGEPVPRRGQRGRRGARTAAARLAWRTIVEQC